VIKLGKLEKYVYGEASTKNLIFGLICVFIAIVLVIWVYTYVSGMASGGEDIVMKHEGIIGLLYYGFGVLFFGLIGGFEIGRYVQTEFTKRRTRTTRNSENI